MIRALWRLAVNQFRLFRSKLQSNRLDKAIKNGTAKRGRTQ